MAEEKGSGLALPYFDNLKSHSKQLKLSNGSQNSFCPDDRTRKPMKEL